MPFDLNVNWYQWWWNEMKWNKLHNNTESLGSIQNNLNVLEYKTYAHTTAKHREQISISFSLSKTLLTVRITKSKMKCSPKIVTILIWHHIIIVMITIIGDTTLTLILQQISLFQRLYHFRCLQFFLALLSLLSFSYF